MVKLGQVEKLEFLWEEVLATVQKGIEDGKFPPQILNNFQLVDESCVKGFTDVATHAANCDVCQNNCCSNIDGKTLLTLRDIAVLIDLGETANILGNYKGFAAMLDNYLENRDEYVFNSVNAMMYDSLNDEYDYMPRLKKIGSSCVFLDDKGKCKIYEDRPLYCRRFPHYLDYETKKVSWETKCKDNVDATEADKREVVNIIVDYENERIRDIALIMLNKDNLAKIGLSAYF